MNDIGKTIVRKLTVTTLAGAGIGFILGYLATRFGWGFGYPAAFGMVIGSIYGSEIIDSITSSSLSPWLEKFSRGKKLLLQMSFSLLSHTAGWLCIIWIIGRIVGFRLFQWEVLIWFILFIAIIFVSRSIRQLIAFYRELGEKDLVEERLKTLAAQAEIRALKAQINPHFLFNSLNTIASLIKTDPLQAEQAVEKLADIFRYTLSSSDREFTTLQNELDFLDSYLDIEEARFGERLSVVKSIQPEVLDTPVPSLIIQPLLENCLKHGIDEEGKVRVEIRCFHDGNRVTIQLNDQGRSAPEEVKQGIYTKGTGLRNVHERLVKLFGAGYGLEMRDNSSGGTTALVTIPKEMK